MRFYDQHYLYYCGIDLHARSMYLCIQDNRGTVLYHKNLPTSRDAFQAEIADSATRQINLLPGNQF